jgi:hypothetical protein
MQESVFRHTWSPVCFLQRDAFDNTVIVIPAKLRRRFIPWTMGVIVVVGAVVQFWDAIVRFFAHLF